jgi:lipopolysaccharide/colanic/teichoic acid biosynthesis glycosyltransferase
MFEENVSGAPLPRRGSVGVASRPLHRIERVDTAASAPPTYLIAKRVLDILVSLTVLLALSPLLVLVAVLIRATSPGPAIYRQRRVGEGGRIFAMYKFRSMHHNSDPSLHRQAYARFVKGDGGNGKVSRETLAELAPDARRLFVPEGYTHRPFKRLWWRLTRALTPEDPRVTPIGALIRRTSIDELPQLFNVLIGDMSLVGPRPPIPYEVRLYSPHHLGRLAVTPGITGMWQVYGRGRVPFEHMVDMDLQYIASRSFWLDLRLLMLTVPNVVFSRGAQ